MIILHSSSNEHRKQFIRLPTNTIFSAYYMHLKINKYLLSTSFVNKREVMWQITLYVSTLFIFASLESRLKEVNFSQIIHSLQGFMGENRTCQALKNWQCMERKKRYMPNPSDENHSQSCKQVSQNKSINHGMEH